MNFLSDIIQYVRRITKSYSNDELTDNLIIDYINRFYLMDVDARIQLFDIKTKYQFQTVPGVDQYNMPLYNVQSETPGFPNNADIGMYPVYQGFMGPAYINGVEISFETEKQYFFRGFPNIVQNLYTVAVGDGGSSYSFQLPILGTNSTPLNVPVQGILRGHVDLTGIICTGVNVDPPLANVSVPTINPLIPSTSILPAVYITTLDATGNSVVVSDSGQFLGDNINYGLLMQPGLAPYGNLPLPGGYSSSLNTINYLTGYVNVNFPVNIPIGTNISVQCYYFQTGLPRALLFYNNTITLRMPPGQQYLVELDAYLSPAAFFNTAAAIPFGYMAEYLARGAARKILSDTGDTEQFAFYEPLFREQEMLVWKRSQRQRTSCRTQSLYSLGKNFGNNGYTGMGGQIL